MRIVDGLFAGSDGLTLLVLGPTELRGEAAWNCLVISDPVLRTEGKTTVYAEGALAAAFRRL
jgi:hypothetical protein